MYDCLSDRSLTVRSPALRLAAPSRSSGRRQRMKPPPLASRRTFTRYVGSLLASTLFAPRAFAQNPVRIHRVGILSDYSEPVPQTPLYHPFWAALSEMGYVEHRNL